MNEIILSYKNRIWSYRLICLEKPAIIMARDACNSAFILLKIMYWQQIIINLGVIHKTARIINILSKYKDTRV